MPTPVRLLAVAACLLAVACSSSSSSNGGAAAPTISSVTGNDAGDPGRVTDGLVVTGSKLDGATLSVTDAGGQPLATTMRSQTATRAELVLPADVRSGSYAVSAVSSAGSAQAAITLTLPELGGDLIVARVNASSSTLSASVLPIGTGAGQVAAGDHAHDGRYVGATGGAIDGDLSVTGDVAVQGQLTVGGASYGGCRLEFDYVERPGGMVAGSATSSSILQGWRSTAATNGSWPSQRLLAELFQYGWICWNRSSTVDPPVQLNPYETTGVTLNQNYSTWQSANTRVCGRLTWSSGQAADGTPATASTDPRLLAWASGGTYYGLYNLTGTGTMPNGNHGLWNDGGGESSGAISGRTDRWTVWTCR
ncbi:MAG: hypothetical protein QM767_29925 [Anaeromyxobacter sp.]